MAGNPPVASFAVVRLPFLSTRTRPHNDLVALPFPMVGSFFDMSGGIGAGLGGQSQIAVTPCYRHEKNGNILLTWNIRVLL